MRTRWQAAALVAGAVLALAPWAGAGVTRASVTCETSWLGGNGLWSDAAKWSNGVPNGNDAARDQVCIGANGTYTVTLVGARTARELTLGGGTGVQTLRIEGNPVNGSGLLQLIDQGGGGAEGIRSNAVVALASTGTGYAALETDGGTLVNNGTIHSQAGAATGRYVHGNLVNNGTLTIESETWQNVQPASWVNNGAITVASGVLMHLNQGSSASFTQAAGTITNHGTFLLTGGFLALQGGTASGNPIEVQSTTRLTLTGGSGSVTSHDSAQLDSGVGSAIEIVAEHVLSVPSSQVNNGRIVLKGGAPSLLVGAGATLTNLGEMEIDSFTNLGGDLDNQDTMVIKASVNANGDLTNRKLLDVYAGVQIRGLTSYTQTNKGQLKVRINSDTSFGQLDLLGFGSVSLAGKITTKKKASYDPTPGTTFRIIAASSLSGAFSKASTVAANEKYFLPTSTSTAVDLVVNVATLTAPASVQRGTQITVGGTTWPPGKAVALKLKASDGTTFDLGSAVAGGAGSFSTDVTVPSGAATGAATLTASAAFTGVKVVKTIDVTH